MWKPARSTPPRTYILRLTVTDARGRRRVYSNPGPRGPVKAPVVRVQGIDAGFLRPSYAPGDTAEVSVATDATSLRLRVSGGAAMPVEVMRAFEDAFDCKILERYRLPAVPLLV